MSYIAFQLEAIERLGPVNDALRADMLVLRLGFFHILPTIGPGKARRPSLGVRAQPFVELGFNEPPMPSHLTGGDSSFLEELVQGRARYLQVHLCFLEGQYPVIILFLHLNHYVLTYRLFDY